jgi:hypothetical protein
MTCTPPFSLNIQFEYQQCDPATSGVSSCFELEINIVDCKAGISASACVIGLFGYGAATVWSPDQGGKCVLMSSCCPTLTPVLLAAQDGSGQTTTTTEDSTPTTTVDDGGDLPTYGSIPTQTIDGSG